MYLSFLYWSI